MQSKAKDVASYLEKVPAERREALLKLRELCLSYEESMDYGGPGYKKQGIAEVGFMSQKNYISLYILKQDALDPHRSLLAGIDVGKGCIRYSKPEKIDFTVVEKLLVATRESTGEIC
jgi:uncharacterized protein YdhG (YjbR/CyaY superfamily)